MNFVVPVAVEFVAPQSYARKFLVFDLGSGWIGAAIQFSVNL